MNYWIFVFSKKPYFPPNLKIAQVITNFVIHFKTLTYFYPMWKEIW